MEITSATTWTVTKDGRELELDLDDISHLLGRLAWSGDLIVVDGESGRCITGTEIKVSTDEDGIDITLLKEEGNNVHDE
jgi:hypothetical protein